MNARALDFPANPSIGDKHKSWKWDGEKWVSMASASGGGGDCECPNPNVWTDELGTDLGLVIDHYLSTAGEGGGSLYPIHPLINWTGGFLQIDKWRIGVGTLGFQMIYSDQPDGMVFTNDGVIRCTGQITSASNNVIPARMTRGNTFKVGDWIISNVGEPLYFYYQGELEFLLSKEGNVEINGAAIANRGSTAKTVDTRAIDHDFGDWYMTTENDDLEFANNNGVMATLTGGGSIAAAGTVKTGEVFI